MPIDTHVFLTEGFRIVDSWERASKLGKEGQYDGSIRALEEVIASATLLCEQDPEVGRRLRLDTTVLVAKGYMLKAYMEQLMAEPDCRDDIVPKMLEIAQGDFNLDNPYFKQIFEAMNEWTEAEARGGDFYTRPHD